MDPRLQRRVQRYGWDAAAPFYEGAWAGPLRPAHDALLDLAALESGQRVLDVACGTGLVTLRAAAAVAPEGSVLATDMAGEMVAETASRATAAGLRNVECVRMEAEDLKLEAATFDAALCALGLMYVPEPVEALREMRRVVRRGGRVAAAVWGERRNCAWAEIFPIVDAVVKSEVCPLFFALGVPGALVAAMQAAGLAQIREERQSVELRFSDGRALLTAQIDGGAVALAAKRFSAEVRREVESAFLASVSGHRKEDGSYVIPGEFVTAVGLS